MAASKTPIASRSSQRAKRILTRVSGASRPEPAPGENLAPGPIEVEVLDFGDGRRLEVARGELLVAYRPDADPDAVAAMHARLDTRVVQRDRHHDIRRIKIPEGADMRAVMSALRRDPSVAWVEPNAVIRGAQTASDDGDPSSTTSSSSGHSAALVPAQWQLSVSDGTWRRAWRVRHFADEVIVALLDSGVAYEDYEDGLHSYVRAPDLPAERFVDGWDFVNWDAHPNDDHQHGTHIASLILSRSALGSAILGYSPKATLMPLKVLDDQLAGTEMTLVGGLYEAVDRGAQVINMSLGFGEQYTPSPMLNDAIEYAALSGVIMVASAGNLPNEASSFPGASPRVISVGASCLSLDDEGAMVTRRCPYASYGPEVEVFGPGGSLAADVDGNGIPDGMIAQSFALNSPTEIGYYAMAGSSQAAAAVTSAAALMLAHDVPPSDVEPLLLRTARDVSPESLDSGENGSGFLDPYKALANKPNARFARPPKVYINLAATLAKGTKPGTLRGVVSLRLIDDQSLPVKYARVWGRWGGSAKGMGRCRTDGDGICELQSDDIRASRSEPVLVSFQAKKVRFKHGYPKPFRPSGFFQLDPMVATDLMYDAAFLMEPWNIVLSTQASSPESQAVFDVPRLQDSYMTRSFGTGLASSSLVMSFNRPYLDRYVAAPMAWYAPPSMDGQGLASSSLIASFQANMFFSSSTLTTQFTGLGLASSSLISPVLIQSTSLQSSQLPTFWSTWGSGLASSSYVFLPSTYIEQPIATQTQSASLRHDHHRDATSHRGASFDDGVSVGASALFDEGAYHIQL